MKKWSVIIAAAVVGVWLAVTTIREFFANETIQYFSSAPYRLLYVTVIAVVGGVAALVFDRLSPRVQRNVKLVLWGGAASLLTLFLGYMIYQTGSSSDLIIANASMRWMIIVLLFCAAIAAYLWYEFYRTLKKSISV